jgi:hypothetical protein
MICPVNIPYFSLFPEAIYFPGMLGTPVWPSLAKHSTVVR